MLRIVVDTNVMVSATYWRGDSNRVIRLADEGKITVVISKEIIEEYNQAIKSDEIAEKIEKKNLVAEQTMTKVINESLIVEPKDKILVVKDDLDDNKFIECAVEGKADFIISRDKHLLKLKSYKNIKIIKPEDFCKML